jgi:hypothetical protein
MNALIKFFKKKINFMPFRNQSRTEIMNDSSSIIK